MKKYKVLVFDMDGTLTPSRQEISDEMINILEKLLRKYRICILAGGKLSLIRKQVINKLLRKNKKLISNLHIFPTSGTAYYRLDEKGKAKKIYQYNLSWKEKQVINVALIQAIIKFKFNPIIKDDMIFDDRESQITISCIGRNAPLELKQKWDPDKKRRICIKEYLKKRLPNFEITIGGTTSIDITKKGLNKGFGINKISEYLKVELTDVLYIGNDFCKDGNDYPVKGMVDIIEVKNDKDCIRKLIKRIK